MWTLSCPVCTCALIIQDHVELQARAAYSFMRELLRAVITNLIDMLGSDTMVSLLDGKWSTLSS